jgi:hypothetical protein
MKSLTALLAVAATLCLANAALAAPAVDSGLAAPANPQQDLRSADQVAPARAHQLQDLRSADRITSGGSLPPESFGVADSAEASTVAVSTSGGGLSALWIVLISVGGATALAAVAYTSIRVMHARGHALS